ncbi:hypothetical protein PPACK8108_LOCUS9668 [Phakopsora pachyrhizi]|uniref:Uncharacterized protein n=1 Tax=Phakopsora pachyrhizi TaxID=170000 RepID=A0AAV0B1H9_PHAPC|nr:hypothetical protein PPACK8108_LOCUS9668 [Phakopsora pachyrhizi]
MDWLEQKRVKFRLKEEAKEIEGDIKWIEQTRVDFRQMEHGRKASFRMMRSSKSELKGQAKESKGEMNWLEKKRVKFRLKEEAKEIEKKREILMRMSQRENEGDICGIEPKTEREITVGLSQRYLWDWSKEKSIREIMMGLKLNKNIKHAQNALNSACQNAQKMC